MKSFVILSFLIALALSKPIEIEDVGIETEDFNVDEIATSEQISEENFRSFRKPTKIRQAEIDSDAARNARFNFGYSIQVKKEMILLSCNLVSYSTHLNNQSWIYQSEFVYLYLHYKNVYKGTKSLQNS